MIINGERTNELVDDWIDDVFGLVAGMMDAMTGVQEASASLQKKDRNGKTVQELVEEYQNKKNALKLVGLMHCLMHHHTNETISPSDFRRKYQDTENEFWSVHKRNIYTAIEEDKARKNA